MATTKILNGKFSIDADAIARGMYDLFSENERACLAFGMLPAEKMRVLEKMLGEKFDAAAHGQYIEQRKVAEIMLGDEGRTMCDEAYNKIRKQFVKEAERLVTLAMYNVTPMVV